MVRKINETQREGLTSPNYYDAEQPENKKKGHQAIVFVDLNDAWLYYEQLGYKLVTFTLEEKKGKKVVSNMPQWKNSSLSVESIKQEHNAIAIITGEASQLMVIDIDKRNADIYALLAEYGLEIDNYCYALTPSGGMHIYLNLSHSELWKMRYGRKTLTTTNKNIGIDIRAEGGLIFAPPSIITNGGCYQWVNMPVNKEDLDYDENKFIPIMDAIFSYNPKPSSLAPIQKQFPQPDFTAAGYFDNQKDYDLAALLISKLNGTIIEYNDWIRMGIALKNKFGKRGLSLWLLFADNSAYQDTEEELIKKWNSFPITDVVHYGTFIYLSREYLQNEITYNGEKTNAV
jgi:hypothetical protein